ncbi:MAG TPA: lysophospholipid acyltransferase family protein [Planctomycetota bacterium]|nr:lysophospholipid acyltransferase family protein [Planctomycetota bacterium]
MRNCTLWYRFCQFWGQVLFSVFFGIRAYGVRHVPRTGPVILASTHQSFLDPIAVELPLARPGHIMARASLFRNGAFRRLIESLNAFPVERDSADLSAFREAIRRLQEGNMLLVFPEATRTRTGAIGRLRPGLGTLASWSEAAVVPVTIDGAFECWPRSRRVFRPGKIRVMYGRPMRLTSRRRADRERFVRELRSTLVEQQQRLREIAGLSAR